MLLNRELKEVRREAQNHAESLTNEELDVIVGDLYKKLTGGEFESDNEYYVLMVKRDEYESESFSRWCEEQDKNKRLG